MDLRAVTTAVPPFKVTSDIIEIQRTVEKLAIGIRVARFGARQGDIFSPEIADVFRRIVRASCRDRFMDLLAIIYDDWESPLPPAGVHARWTDRTPR